MAFFYLVLSIGLVLGLAFRLWQKTADSKLLKFAFWPALAFRLLSGVLLGYIYFNQIITGGDTWTYQIVGEMLTGIGKTDPGAYFDILLFNQFADPEILAGVPYPTYTNSFFFIKFVSLLNFISGSNYYLNSLFVSLFSFAGCWLLVLKLGEIFPASRKAAVLALLFFPSVVFWNSGLLKDGVLLGTLGFFWAAALQLAYYPERKKLLPMLLILLSGMLLWKIKFFVAAFVFALTGSWFALHWLYKRYRFFRSGYKRWLAVPVIIGLIVLGFSQLHYKFNLAFLLMSLKLNNELFRADSVGKPIIDLAGMEATLPSVLWHTPEALAGVFFRPFLGEGDTVFYRLAGLENLLLLALFIGAFIGIHKLNLKKYPGFYLILLIFSLCLAAAFGLSTPNLGSLSRYRTAFLPFVVFLLLETPFWRQVLARLASRFRSGRA